MKMMMTRSIGRDDACRENRSCLPRGLDFDTPPIARSAFSPPPNGLGALQLVTNHIECGASFDEDGSAVWSSIASAMDPNRDNAAFVPQGPGAVELCTPDEATRKSVMYRPDESQSYRDVYSPIEIAGDEEPPIIGRGSSKVSLDDPNLSRDNLSNPELNENAAVDVSLDTEDGAIQQAETNSPSLSSVDFSSLSSASEDETTEATPMQLEGPSNSDALSVMKEASKSAGESASMFSVDDAAPTVTPGVVVDRFLVEVCARESKAQQAPERLPIAADSAQIEVKRDGPVVDEVATQNSIYEGSKGFAANGETLPTDSEPMPIQAPWTNASVDIVNSSSFESAVGESRVLPDSEKSSAITDSLQDEEKCNESFVDEASSTASDDISESFEVNDESSHTSGDIFHTIPDEAAARESSDRPASGRSSVAADSLPVEAKCNESVVDEVETDSISFSTLSDGDISEDFTANDEASPAKCEIASIRATSIHGDVEENAKTESDEEDEQAGCVEELDSPPNMSKRAGRSLFQAELVERLSQRALKVETGKPQRRAMLSRSLDEDVGLAKGKDFASSLAMRGAKADKGVSSTAKPTATATIRRSLIPRFKPMRPNEISKSGDLETSRISF